MNTDQSARDVSESKMNARRFSVAMADGSFPVEVNLPCGLIEGTGHPLWSDAAFLNVCIRPRLIA